MIKLASTFKAADAAASTTMNVLCNMTAGDAPAGDAWLAPGP